MDDGAPPAALVRKNVVAFACGPTGTGKSQWLYDVFTARTPRVLTLDTKGETLERNPDALYAHGLDDTIRALQHCARNGTSWHVAAQLHPRDVPALIRRIAPPDAPAGVPTFARAVGGIALECGEVYTIAPNSGASDEVLSLLRAGRHDLVSCYFAAQRPASCARDCTAQAHHIAAFRTYEPRDIKFLCEFFGGGHVEDLIFELPDFHFLYRRRGDRFVYVCDAARRPLRRLDMRGREAPL